MSFLSGLGKILSIAGPIAAIPFTGGASAGLLGMSAGTTAALGAGLGAAGSALGGLSKGAAQNRDAQFSGQFDLAKLLADRDHQQQQLALDADNSFTSNQIAREKSGMDTRDDAWKKLLSAQHTISPSMAPQNAGPYNVAQRMPTDAEKQGAGALSDEVMARLQGGNQVAPVTRTNTTPGYDPLSTIDPKLLKPGTAEKIGGILSPILTGGGGLLGAMGGGMKGPSVYGSGGAPGSPVLSAADLAWLKSQSPRLA